MKIYNLSELTSSRIQYDKNPPKFLFYVIITFLVLLISLILLACFTNKTEVIRINGVFASDNKVYIQSPIQGEIKRVYKQNNDYVEKGDLLFELDQTQIDSSIISLKAKSNFISNYVENYNTLIDSLNNIDVNDLSKLKNPFSEGEFYLNFKAIVQSLENATETENQTIEENRRSIIEQYLSSAYQSKFQYEYELIGNQSQIQGYEEMKKQYFVYADTSGYLTYTANVKSGSVIDYSVIGSISEKINVNNSTIECYLPTEHRNFINLNQNVEIIISGLSQAKYGTLKGKILKISDDIISDNENNIYYKVSIKPDSIQLNDKKLSNGQVGEVRIKYDSITWMTWALKKIGILDR